MSGVSGFCRTVSHVKVIKVNSGNCFAKLTLQEDDLNPMGGMHGGLAATLIDNISSTGLLSHSKWREPSPTIRLNLSYLRNAQYGEEITIESKVLKVGKNMAFVDVEIRNAEKELLVKGEHVKLRSSSS
ncbi:acyl-coenzyme A thioesterase 13-like [Atheta coriaria]|uniref:acyl-coenzyme A thioesterase 13-like n=1 Tax=Dalotia coriaria TaxID=877792 RepID=UPI0031F44C25